MIKDSRAILRPGSLSKSKCWILLLGAMLAVLPTKSMVPENHRDVVPVSDPIYVYCLVQNQWVNGQVENLADVELRDGKTSGPVIDAAEVLVNGQRLAFDRDTQGYKGSIGDIEQWQRIPLDIKTRDGRTIAGYVTVVYLVEFIKPGPWAEVPLSPPLPLQWEYSENSMHTVDLLVWKDGEEPPSFRVRGNSTTLDLKQRLANLKKDDVVHIQIYPPRTSNYEFDGYTTRRSKAEFVTTAAVSVKIAGE